jgi:hypothetical protein
MKILKKESVQWGLIILHYLRYIFIKVVLCEISEYGRMRGCIQKFPDWVDNEIYAYNNKHSLRSNIKGCGGKTR